MSPVSFRLSPEVQNENIVPFFFSKGKFFADKINYSLRSKKYDPMPSIRRAAFRPFLNVNDPLSHFLATLLSLLYLTGNHPYKRPTCYYTYNVRVYCIVYDLPHNTYYTRILPFGLLSFCFQADLFFHVPVHT